MIVPALSWYELVYWADESLELLSTAHGGPLLQFTGSITVTSSSAPIEATVQQGVSSDRGHG